MTVDIGQPTHTRTCTVSGCGRVVGPYFDRRQAERAIEEHRYTRHRAIRPGTPCLTGTVRGDGIWESVDGE